MRTTDLIFRNDRLTFRDAKLNLLVRRSVTEAMQKTFQQWIESYQQAVGTPDCPNHLLQLGREMWQWLGREFDDALERIASDCVTPPLLLQCFVAAEPDAVQLLFLEVPWEILANEKGFLAQSHLQFSPVRRFGYAVKDTKPASKYGLSLTFMAAAPRNLSELSFEAEEAAILQAVNPRAMDFTVEESGNLRFLAEHLAREKPDVLHISCHGTRTPEPALSLEDEPGDEKPATATDLIRELSPNTPRLLFVSACQTAEPNKLFNSLASILLRNGFPAVLGWGGQVDDEEAIEFASRLYRSLSEQCELEKAVALARHALLNLDREAEQEVAEHWHLARLYLSPVGGGVLARGRSARRPHHLEHGHKEFLDIRGQKVPVASRYEFVGRRKYIQDILRVFRDFRYAGVVIHGIGRQGKSSLAARVANRMPDHDVAVVYGSYDAVAILEALEMATPLPETVYALQETRRRGFDHAEELLGVLLQLLQGPFRTAERDRKGRYRSRPILLIFDDFEQALEPPEAESDAAHRIKAEYRDAIRAVIQAFDLAATDSRLLFTSRHVFELRLDDRNLADRLRFLPLGYMSQVERRKQMQAKIRMLQKLPDALPFPTLDRCIDEAHGNPGLQDRLLDLALQNPRAALDILQEMERYFDQGKMPEKEELLEFLQNLTLETLLRLLRPGERQLLRAATLFELPVPISIFQHLADLLGPGTNAVERLLGFGLLDGFEDLVVPKQPAAVVDPLVRPLITPALTSQEQKHLAKRALPRLWERWGDQEWPSGAAYQLARLALLAGDAEIIETAGPLALRYAQNTLPRPQAAELAENVWQLLRRKKRTPSLDLLIRYALLLGHDGKLQKAGKLLKHAARQILSSTDPIVDRDPAIAASTLALYGRILMKTGKPDQALPALQKAMDLFSKANMERGCAIAKGDIARIFYRKGKVDEALRLCRQSLNVFEKHGDRQSKAKIMGDIARIFYQKGQIDEALKLHQRRLNLFKELDDLRSQALTMGDIAHILHEKGQLDEALKLYQERYRILENLGYLQESAISLDNIAIIFLDKGQADKAIRLQRQRLKAFKKLDYNEGIANALWGLSLAFLDKGKKHRALKLMQQSYKINLQIGYLEGICFVGMLLGPRLCTMGQVQQGLEILQRSLTGFQKMGEEDLAQEVKDLIRQFKK